MDKNGIIALIIFLVIVVVSLSLLIFFIVRNKKYKSFVLANSDAIKGLNTLNDKYKFKDFIDTQTIRHRFDNKSTWNKTEAVAFLTREIRTNLDKWYSYLEPIKFNRDLFASYKEDVGKVFKPISNDVCVKNEKNYKKCLKVEKKIFESNLKIPKVDCNVIVSLRYVSPKGKVDITKTGRYNYESVLRIARSVSSRRVDEETYRRLVKAERAIISDSMRYDVLRRDKFRCVLCGMSASDGAILHVDHIIPVSKGGKSTMNNLRTLCEQCNLGKSNKLE